VKRFYAEVATGRDEAGGFTVLLDGRPVRTPARRVLALPSAALAEAVAEVWRAQGEAIVAASMPLTRLATTAIDLMPARRADAIAEAADYAGTDLLCYRATGPETLVARQRAAWQTWLDWAERQYDARLVLASDVAPVDQPEPSLRALRAAVERLDDWRLVGLHAAVTLLGSLVLGLALERCAIDSERAFEVALLDELFEIERWGEEEQQQRRHARIKADLAAAERFLRCLAG
jgi:chaperone required for assembly of F1-ATPase